VKFHAVHRAWLRTPPAAGVPDVVIGTWVRVCTYAADVEAGVSDQRVKRHRPLGRARVVGCGRWSRRAWSSSCDTTRKAVDAVVAAGLAAWDGDDLLLDGYDVWGEERTRRIRHSEDDAGGNAGRKSGENAGRKSGEHPGEGRGDVGRGNVGRGNVGRGNVPEGSAAAGEALPTKAPTPHSPTSGSPGKSDPPPERDGEAQRPERARDPAEPDPAAQLANCLRAHAGTTASDSEKRALVAYCASLPAAKVQPALYGLWDYWKADKSPTVTAWLARQHGVRR
jgi:hypothetical protein